MTGFVKKVSTPFGKILSAPFKLDDPVWIMGVSLIDGSDLIRPVSFCLSRSGREESIKASRILKDFNMKKNIRYIHPIGTKLYKNNGASAGSVVNYLLETHKALKLRAFSRVAAPGTCLLRQRIKKWGL